MERHEWIIANLNGINRVFDCTVLTYLSREQHLLLIMLPSFSSLLKFLAKRLDIGPTKINFSPILRKSCVNERSAVQNVNKASKFVALSREDTSTKMQIWRLWEDTFSVRPLPWIFIFSSLARITSVLHANYANRIYIYTCMMRNALVYRYF